MSWADAGELAAEYLTPYGNYLSAEAAVDDFGEGNWGSGALNTLGAVVGAGAVGAGLRRGGHLMLEGIEKGVPMGSARSQLGIYAGPGAKTADLNALAEARRMAEGGADNETIRAATNWFQGPDQKWRFEIDDSASRSLGPRSIEEAARLERGEKVGGHYPQSVLEHPEMSHAYPDTEGIGVVLDPNLGEAGSYNRIPMSSQSSFENIRVGTQPDYGVNRSTMLHELQHAIQQREGFARGGTPENALTPFYDDINKKMAVVVKEMEKHMLPGQWRKFKSPEGDKLAEEYDRLMALKSSANPYEAYRKLAGEVEARDVQARMDFTPEQRRATVPYSSQGIAPEDMTINFLGGENKATVWHGSPHKFAPTERNALGEFDISKVGTGEGAQAYGHGVYLAENPAVAKNYQFGLGTVTRKHVTLGGKKVTPAMEKTLREDPAYKNVLLQVPGKMSSLQFPKKLDNVIAHNEQHAERFRKFAEERKANPVVASTYSLADYERMSKAYAKNANELKAFREKVGLKDPQFNSHLYKVDLPDEHIAKMLDWDKPMKDQSPEVKDMLKKAGAMDSLLTSDEAAGTVIRRAEANRYSAADLFSGGTGELPLSPAQISQRFKEAGIPGTRYLDGFSRRREGTSNYVVFDPAITRILGRE